MPSIREGLNLREESVIPWGSDHADKTCVSAGAGRASSDAFIASDSFSSDSDSPEVLMPDAVTRHLFPGFSGVLWDELRDARAVRLSGPYVQLIYFTGVIPGDRKSTRLNSSHVATSYAVFC